jgi:ribosomal protein L11 methyltransferase
VSKPLAKPAWLEVSVTVSEEVSEAVADTMARYATGGVVLGHQSIAPDPDGEGTPCGPMEVRAYLPYDDALEEKRDRLAEALWHLGRIASVPDPVFRSIAEEDWSLAWKKHYRPIRIGKRLHIIPSWYKTPVRRGDVALRLDPGMAFGTGTHPTTQLCLEAIEQQIRKGDFVIDLGCGSGILAIAAKKLGAGRVWGVDTDRGAVEIARENARRNRVAKNIEFREGSLALLVEQHQQAPLVVVNILAVVLERMLEEGLGDIVLTGGKLILSGVLMDQSAKLEAMFDKHRLRLVEKLTRDDWVALIATRVE